MQAQGGSLGAGQRMGCWLQEGLQGAGGGMGCGLWKGA